MTDAEPAPSCATQFQVKVRRCNQVIMLTSFPFAFYGLRLLPCRQWAIILRLSPCNQDHDSISFSNPNCHCEPFASCYSERSEESYGAQDRLREAISLLLSEIASAVCFVPRNASQ